MKKKIILFLFLFLPFISDSQNKNKAIWQQIMSLDTISNNENSIKKSTFLLNKITNNKIQEDSIRARVYHILGRAYKRKGFFLEGKIYTQKAILLNSKKNPTTSKKQLALSLLNLAGIEFAIHEFKSSISNYDKCIYLFKKLNFKLENIPNSYRMKSTIYYILGDYLNCILNADKAIANSNKNEYIILEASTEKIQALIELKQYKSAKTILDFQIKNALVKFPNSLELANLFSISGSYNVLKKNFDEAKINFSKSYSIHKYIKNELGCAQVNLEIGGYLIKQKKYYDAFKYLNNSIIESKDYQDYVLRAFYQKAKIYYLQKKFDFALKEIQIAFSNYFKEKDFNNFEINPSPNLISGKVENEAFLNLIQHKAETWLAYYHHTHKREYLQNALETFAVADKMVDYMRREHVGYQSKLFWRDKTHSLYENAIEVCFLLKNYEDLSKNIAVNKKNKTLFQGSNNSIWDEKAFYFFEKSRAVLLNDKINNLSANQLLSEADQLKERSFQQEISELNSKIESETVEAKKSQWNVKMLDIQESQQKFIVGLAVKYPSYFAFKYDTSMYNLGHLRQYLSKSNTSFIEYFKGDSANYQLVIKPTGVNIIKQKPSENSYHYLINESDLGKRVIVSQDGEFVPLDTLKNTKGEILLKKYAFSNTYSAQYLLRNAEKKVENSWLNNFIGFAPVNYSKSMALPSLLGADVALGNVSSNYFWAKNYEKEKATKANFSKNASDYKIIQLFTHADADNANIEPTIFFADSSMKVSELESFSKFNTELLVLSACKTNVGKVAKGEGTLSMAREFAGLGIPASITTLWSVENGATYQITELFYKYLKIGEPKDIALQKAKLEYLEINSREKQDPKYWAAFVLMGETAPIKGFDGKIVYISLLILASIVAFLFFFERHKRLNIK